MKTWLLLGVEDTADVQQKKTKGQKNEEINEDNRFVERRSFCEVYCVSYTKKEPKTLQMFSIRTTPEKFENASNTSHFKFVVKGNQKLHFQNLSVQTNSP